MHVRINLKFIKTQVAPLIENYRTDLFNFCHERAHPFDFFRELLNIYFDKPTNNMKYATLDIRKTSLACLEPLREQFELHYNEPQKSRSDANTRPTGVLSNADKPHTGTYGTIPASPGNTPTQGTNAGVQTERVLEQPPIIPAAPYHTVPPPPKPIWNDVLGMWEVPQVIHPPEPDLEWDHGQNIWVIKPEEPVIEIPEVDPEDAAKFLASLPANQPIVEEIDTINESHDPAPTTIKMRDVVYDPNMFIPIKTDTILDDYMSLTGGIMPATNIMVQGPAGSGKSSVLIDIGCKMVKADKKKRVLFLSGEMTRIDMKGLNDRFDGFEDLDILFLNEYTDTDTRILLETILSTGWDVVIVDSFSEVLGSIIDTAQGTSINTKSGEKWLINQFLKHNEGGNDLNLPTMFFFILQVGKDGNFVGSNRIKHAATAFMNIEFTKNRNLFIYFSKNRRGETHNNLYFEHHGKGIHFDFKRYKEDIAIREALKRSEVANKEAWGKLLDENNDDSNTKITVKAAPNTREEDRSESLLGSITSYDTTGPGAPDDSQIEDDGELKEGEVPIPDRRTMHLNRQVTLDDVIDEVEIEEKEAEEVEEIIPENEIMIEPTEPLEQIESAEVETMEETIIPETIEVQEEKEDEESPLKKVDLHDDEPIEIKEEVEEVIEKEEVEEKPKEEIVEKSIPKDNPNAHDFSNLVEL